MEMITPEMLQMTMDAGYDDASRNVIRSTTHKQIQAAYLAGHKKYLLEQLAKVDEAIAQLEIGS